MAAFRRTTGIDDISAFGISRERGFLPEPDPLVALPGEFAPWEDVAAQLPKLMLAGRVRRVIETLPLLPTKVLADDGQLRRAMLVLSYLGHAYVWGDERPAAHLPRPLAVPWHAVSQRLGRPPVLSYASYALDNWRRFDPDGSIAIGNIAILQNFLGGIDEDWFITIHVDIECRAARILRATGPALSAAAAADARQLTDRLEAVAAGLASLVASLERMPEHCDPYIYYRRVRPYIHGWRDNPALPNGVVYEGVEAYAGRPQRFRGETGAQSGIVPLMDALLGVVHADDPLRTYLMEMRDYMPPDHRAYLTALETAAPPFHSFVRAAAQSDRNLRLAYNACLDCLTEFRTLHLEYAARYIFSQSQSDLANPNVVGTGGTPFMDYLRKHRDETAAHRIADR